MLRIRSFSLHSEPAGLRRAARQGGRDARPGVVLLTVLIAIVLMSLAAYNYSDLMLAEYRASDNYHKNAQARAYADSGIHYAMAVLSDPDSIGSILNGNPFDNPPVFQGHSVGGNGGQQGYFTLMAPLSLNNNDASGGTCLFGVIDEGAKININAWTYGGTPVLDPTGTILYNMLQQLPNMTQQIAANIVTWVNPNFSSSYGGVGSDYYSGLSPPYNCKNGPLDSIEELLLVDGVTPQLLFGADYNRNGYLDQNETNDNNTTPSNFDLGWAAYLTVYSREQNLDPTGLPLINLNDKTVDLPTMYGSLETKLNPDLAKFIIMALQNGVSSVTTGATANASATPAAMPNSSMAGTGGGKGAGTGGGTGGVTAAETRP